jgi:hypothetical protein
MQPENHQDTGSAKGSVKGSVAQEMGKVKELVEKEMGKVQELELASWYPPHLQPAA